MSDRHDMVTYITPFDRQRKMPRWQAENYLDQDQARWNRLQELDHLTDTNRAIGPPRIDGAPVRKMLIDNDGLPLTEGNDFA